MTTATLQPSGTTHNNGRAMPPGRTPPPDPYKWTAIGVVLMFALTLPTVIVMVAALQPEPVEQPWSAEAAALGVRPYDIARGAEIYGTSCALCHGKQGEGVKRLGKPLRNSAYVQEATDEELFRLLARGRPAADPENTTGVLMPARGAQNLTDSQLRAVMVYMSALQDPTQPHADVEAWAIRAPGEAVESVPPSGGGGGPSAPGYELFVAACSACHGEYGQGIEGVGLPLDSRSGFVSSLVDKELSTFIKMGRATWDADNQTGMDMPPKGGNPALSDADLNLIIQYIRSLHERND